jgi:RNA polymerase sigma factor (sigma-70 family)
VVAFCEEQIPRLVGVLTLYCGDRSVAEELAQEALARAMQSWDKIGHSEVRGGWIYRVAINLANSRFRRTMAERRANRKAAAATEDSMVEDTATGVAVREAVAQLPRRQRAAVTLRYYLDLPVAEVARAMECPESTVKTLTRRGLERLKKVLDEDEVEVRHG